MASVVTAELLHNVDRYLCAPCGQSVLSTSTEGKALLLPSAAMPMLSRRSTAWSSDNNAFTVFILLGDNHLGISASLCALLGVLSLQTVVVHQRDGDGLEQLAPNGVGQVEHLAVMVARLEGGNAQENRFDMLNKGTTTSLIGPGSQ